MRIDPEDNKPRTISELQERYGHEYNWKEIVSYWEMCTPLADSPARSPNELSGKLES